MAQSTCPICGQLTVTFEPHPDKPGRERGFCPCHPLGAVVERQVPAKPKIKKLELKEQENDNT